MKPVLTLRATQALLGSELLVSYFLRARVGNAHSCSQGLLSAIPHIIKDDTGKELKEKYRVRSLFSPHAETCRARLPAEDPAPRLSALIRRWGGSICNVLVIRRKARCGGDGRQGNSFVEVME